MAGVVFLPDLLSVSSNSTGRANVVHPQDFAVRRKPRIRAPAVDYRDLW